MFLRFETSHFQTGALQLRAEQNWRKEVMRVLTGNILRATHICCQTYKTVIPTRNLLGDAWFRTYSSLWVQKCKKHNTLESTGSIKRNMLTLLLFGTPYPISIGPTDQ